MGGPEADPITELLTEAEVLLDLDAARAEAWASGLLADWPDHVGLLDTLQVRNEPAALAIVQALVPMVAAAAPVAATIRERGVEAPVFAPFAGTARAVGAWTIRERHGTATSIVVEYEHDDGVRHDMLAELDGEVAVDLLVGPPGVVDAARDADDRRLVVEPIEPQAALDAIRAGMQRVLDGEVALLTDAYFLNHALVASRVGLPIEPPELLVADAPIESRAASADPEGDALARSTLAAALARQPAAAPDNAVAAAAGAWRASFDRGDHDAVTVAEHADVGGDDDDMTVLVRLAGAYAHPGPRTGMAPAAAEAIDALEWADWLGAVLPLVRAGAGADASPEQLVRNINRCPEVTTSIPKRDAPAVASAFGCAMGAWRVAGAVDADDRLTDLGAWLLPRALAAAWGASPGEL